MKRTLLVCLCFLLLPLAAYPLASDSREVREEEQPLPENRTLLVEMLDESKVKYDLFAKTESTLDEYLTNLQQLKNNIAFPAGNDAAEQLVNNLLQAVENKDYAQISAAQASLGQLIQKLKSLSYVYYPSQYGYNSAAYSSELQQRLNALSSQLAMKFSDQFPDYVFAPVLPSYYPPQFGGGVVSANGDTVAQVGGRVNFGTSVTVTKDQVVSLQKIFTSASIKKYVEDIQAVIGAEIDKVNQELTTVKQDAQQERQKRALLIEKVSEDTQINTKAINIGLPLFCLTILLLFLGPSLIEIIKHRFTGNQDRGRGAEAENAGAATNESSQGVLVEISTVLLLTMSILILGLSGKIKSEVLGTLIGGISGYVLNRVRVSLPGDKAPDAQGK